MENFKKSFISAATKYADYVGAKISNTAEIKKLQPGSTILFEENPLEAAKVLCEEMQELNATAVVVKKMEEAEETEIDLTEAELEEITLTPEQEEELKKKILFAISKDNETGEVEICPMNEKGCITLHGEEEVKWFINRLRETWVQEQQPEKAINPVDLKNQKREYLNLAKKFHVPIAVAIKYYDTLSTQDT